MRVTRVPPRDFAPWGGNNRQSLTLQLWQLVAKAKAPVQVANVKVSSVTFIAGPLSPQLFTSCFPPFVTYLCLLVFEIEADT